MLKKIKILDIFIVFAFTFLCHFLYKISQNDLFSIMFPVNESIWEHMKLLVTPFYLVGIFDYFYLNKELIKFNNFFMQLFLIPIISILVYLIIYLPIYNYIGENMIISIVLLFLVIILQELLSYIFLTSKRIKYENIIGILGIIFTYIVLGYLTYNPIINYIFYDNKDLKYGINIYKKV